MDNWVLFSCHYVYALSLTESICVCAKEWELSAVIRETLNIHTEVRVLELPTQSMTRLRPTTNSHLKDSFAQKAQLFDDLWAHLLRKGPSGENLKHIGSLLVSLSFILYNLSTICSSLFFLQKVKNSLCLSGLTESQCLN